MMTSLAIGVDWFLKMANYTITKYFHPTENGESLTYVIILLKNVDIVIQENDTLVYFGRVA